MTTSTVKHQAPDAAPAGDDHRSRARAIRRVSGAMTFARTLSERLPGTVDATVAGANDTTTELQRLPDSTLRLLAAGSVGLGAGFYLAGAPRVIVAAGITPALVMGAAIVLRPIVPARWPTSTPMIRLRKGLPDMTDQHTKGVISKAQGKVEEGLGKVTGDKPKQAQGKVRQVQGEVQEGLGDVHRAVTRPRDKT